MKAPGLSRRRFIKTTAASAVALAAPYVKTAGSAGSLSLGLWDHWVPGANEAMEKICLDWGAANNVDVSVDFITSIGNKLLLTAQAESRAKTGHDIYSVPLWLTSIFRESLEPLDDLAAEVKATEGDFVPIADYLAQLDGVWRAVPAPTGSLHYAMVSRRDLFQQHADIDLSAIFPAHDDRDPALVDSWTFDAFAQAAEKLHAAGAPFGAAIAPVPDAAQWLGQLFQAYGAVLVDEAGEITVNSEETREVLEYLKRLTAVMPEGMYAWDDAGNNRWMISGTGSSIFNPPSAWAVAKRDNPDVAKHFWHHDGPRGPAGRFRAGSPFFWGIWSFSENIGAGKALLRHVTQRDVVEQMLQASQGFDVPLIRSHFEQSQVWEQAEPPSGVLYNYPVRGDEQHTVAGFPAPPNIASQIATQGAHANLVARVTQGGESIDDAIWWAENELEGYLRG